MRTLVLLLFFLLSGLQLIGQDSIAPSKTYPQFQLLRSEEDYRFLKNDWPGDYFWEKIKYIALSRHTALSVGGDARSQFQVLRNEDWEPEMNDEVLYQRFMFHADLYINQKIRLFGQLKSGLTLGRNGAPSTLDQDQLDLHQLFVGLKLASNRFEVGRRELLYGSRRLMDVREGTNVRQSFDGARWIWQQSNTRLDLLFYAYNPQQLGLFDNQFRANQLIWGSYFVWNIPNPQGPNFDFYYLGVRNERPRFEEGTLLETRHSVGVRYWGAYHGFRYNHEAIFQTGRFGQGAILAWTLSTEISFRLPGRLRPSPGLKAEIISGDRRNGDGDLNTFNALYPRGGYFGLLALIGPANLMDIHPSIALSIGKKWSLNLDADFFWRQSLEDGIYFPSGRLHVPGNGSNARFIGYQPGLQLSFESNRFLELEASCFSLITGEFFQKTTAGSNYTQIGISASLKF
jgi:hypothetical protein